MKKILDRLNAEKKLSPEDWLLLFQTFTAEDSAYAGALARDIAQQRFQNKIYFRGIIEFTNFCKNDCLYCGIRKSNANACRYRLSETEILHCCEEGYALGFRTFVLQGGEDPYYNDTRMTALVSEIHQRYADCAITLSLGERSQESYQRLFDAGATRYLLRHETADATHYQTLHPPELSWQRRMDCLRDLKKIGYQTGCGCMVGTPGQTAEHLVKEMLFLTTFRPEMIGIGPFIPHEDTPFKNCPAGDTETTLFMLSLCRILLPNVLLPATTALGTIQNDGRQGGILAGANVIMPNLSPLAVRKNYMLYNHKVGTEDDVIAGTQKVREQVEKIGYQVVVDRGDFVTDNGQT
ncbi:MAG: [FeFe] hydrogenase H-cluster radical SAM maturase HydE [Evtepia sp.]